MLANRDVKAANLMPPNDNAMLLPSLEATALEEAPSLEIHSRAMPSLISRALTGYH